MNTLKRTLNSRVASIVTILKITSISIVGYAQSNSNLSYPQVSTGQVLAYDAEGKVIENLKPGDALYGQDAHYPVGAAMNYKDNGDGTVTDLNTGLMWQMIPIKQGFTWQGAQDYCESLELGGYDDWRVPSTKELYSISDFSTGWPYLNNDYFKLIEEQRVGKDEQYWSSHKYVGSAVQGGSTLAFGVNHATGHIKAYGAGDQAENSERPQQARQRGQQGEQRDTTAIQGERPQRSQQQARQGGQQSGEQRPQRDTTATQGDRPQRSQQQARQGGQQSGEQRPQRDSTATQGDRPQRSQQQARQGGQQSGEQRPQRDSTATQGDRPQRSQQQARQGGQQGGQQSGGNRSQKYVRAVRGAEYGVNNFVDNGDGTITDNATALMWAKVDSKEGMEWITALKYAEDAELAGYSDWRLPNVKELQGIVNYNYAPSATDPAKVGAAIDPMFVSTPIVNENGDDDYPYIWTSTSALTRKNQPFYFAWYVSFGRAVSPEGIDSHGAGAVRFYSKYEGGESAEGGLRSFNFVRLVRNVK